MNDLLEIYVPRLNRAALRYMVTGSVASMFFGEIRNTVDVDVVLELPAVSARLLVKLFPEEEFYLPPLEVMEVEARRRQRGHFNILHHTTPAGHARTSTSTPAIPSRRGPSTMLSSRR